MILAIDFDGVIHDQAHPKPGRRMGEPIDGTLEAITRFKQGGHEIIVFTSRARDADTTKVVLDWLEWYRIPFDRITNIKPVDADVFIDDKAVRFIAWSGINL